MRTKEILIVTSDTKYILPIVGRLVEIYDGSCGFTLVSESDKLENAIARLSSVDVLIVDRALYDNRLKELNVSNTLILTEQGTEELNDKTGSITERLNLTFVNKFQSVKEVINEIISCPVLRDIIEDKGVTTKLVAVYSPVGGSGTTTLSTGLAAVLTKKHKKVLYQNICELQNFAYGFKNKTPLKEAVVKNFKETDNDFYENIKRCFREEVFTYVPPFPRSFSSLDIHDSHIVQAITKIKDTGIYDYIVVDTSTDLSGGTSELMAMADKVLIVGKSDECSKYKLKVFLKGIDCSDKDRFMYVSNFSEEDQTMPEVEFHAEKVERDPKIPELTIEELTEIRDIERLGIMFI